MNSINMQPVKSSNIKAIGYDEESKTLQIQFKNGRAYQYKDVPLDTFEAFQHADSVGKYYFARIQKNYECEKIEVKLEESEVQDEKIQKTLTEEVLQKGSC
jgi:hypothetical protein